MKSVEKEEGHCMSKHFILSVIVETVSCREPNFELVPDINLSHNNACLQCNYKYSCPTHM